MGLFKSLFGKPAKKGKPKQAVNRQVRVASKPVMKHRLYNGSYEDKFDLPRPKEDQGELFFTGECESPIYTYYPLSTKGMRKGQKMRVEIIPQDVEFYWQGGDSVWRSDEWNDPVASYNGMPFGGLSGSYNIFKSLARKGYKVVLDARYEGMYDRSAGIPEIVLHLPDSSELRYWGWAIEKFDEFVPFDEYCKDSVGFTVQDRNWDYPDEVEIRGATNFSLEYVVPEKKTRKPRIQVKYKDCVLREIFESNSEYEVWNKRLSQPIRHGAAKRYKSAHEEGGYFWRIYLMFGE